MHVPEEILYDWSADPERPVLLVDETRRALYTSSDELVIFTCASLTARDACDVLIDAATARKVMGEEPFKGLDLMRREAQAWAAPILRVLRHALELLCDVKMMATRASCQKRSVPSHRARIRTISDTETQDLPTAIEGRDLPAILHLLKVAANSQDIGDRQIDAIVDRSDQNGLGPSKRRLPRGTMEVLGPEPLNRRADGSPAELMCPASFQLIAASDQGPFRDLLLVPDLIGHLWLEMTANADLHKLADSLVEAPYRLIPFDLKRVQANLRT